LHEEPVRVPVVAALELDDLVALRGRPRDADGAHGGFGARADEADALQRGHERRHTLAEMRLELGRRAEARAARRRCREGLQEAPRRVAVDERPPRHHVVDVLVAVGVVDPRAFRAADEKRRAAYRFERANRTVDAAGEDARGGGEQPRRFRRPPRPRHFFVTAPAMASEAFAMSGVSRSSPLLLAFALSVLSASSVAPSAVATL